MPEEPKKMALLRILQILTKYTDADHPLTQQAIIEKLDELYNIQLERKAIATNISLLLEAEYDIIQIPRKGYYLAGRAFEDGELHFLIDNVTGNPFVKSRYTKELIGKLSSFSNKYFDADPAKVTMEDDENFEYNSEFFMNIEVIYKAIENGVAISYDYNNYDENLQLQKSGSYTASPYKIITHNQGYYLMCYVEEFDSVAFHRVERMTNIKLLKKRVKPIETVPGLDGGRLQRFLAASRPYLYADEPERITMIVSNYPGMISQLVDWLGKNIEIKEANDGYGSLLVTVMASPQAIKYWAMQYSNYVEVTEPQEIREEIYANLSLALEKYER